MAGMRVISLSWVLCVELFLLGSFQGSRASIVSSAYFRIFFGRSVAEPPSGLSSHESPLHHSYLRGRALPDPPSVPTSLSSPSYLPGPLQSPASSPYPSSDNGVPIPSPSSSPSPTVSYTKVPVHSPAVSPSRAFPKNPFPPRQQPVKALPPPPPNLDCSSTYCVDPLTNTPPGVPCACVLPMKVGVRVSIELYAFFPLVSKLAQEIASGVSMEQSQVRVMGANAASGEPEKTIVLINLVPRGEKFDNYTAFATYEKFWQKQIPISRPFFGNYDVLSVVYPGLPPSPPAAPIQEFGYVNNPMITHPFAVDVKKPEGRHHNSSLVAIIVLSSMMTLILCTGIALVLFLRHRYHKHLAGPGLQTSLPTFTKSSGIGFSRFGSKISSGSASISSSFAAHIGAVKTFSLSEIAKATDKFDDSRIIGEGGFGLVYEGVLQDGTQVAVKVLKRDDQQGVREFLAEVEMLSRLHHRNLVKLLGICTEEYLRCLVYELIPNGSVESHLYGADKETAPLDWNSRMKIAIGAARSLAYLHEDTNPHVIHRDFKSSNILLEHDFTPKVCDFGLARTALGEANEHISTRVMGTFGYVAPEYAMTGHLLVKSDVYSYGVVLLELLTGRKPVDMLRPPGQENLVTWARPLLTSKEGLETIIDPSIGTDFSADSLAKVAAIASMCIQPEVSQRPFMGEVVQALKLVCSENEYKGSGSFSHQEVTGPDTGMRTNKGLDLEKELELSPSDMFSMSERFTRDEPKSFQWSSSSGPLRTGRSSQAWQWVSGLSRGSHSDHGIRRKRLDGSEDWL